MCQLDGDRVRPEHYSIAASFVRHTMSCYSFVLYGVVPELESNNLHKGGLSRDHGFGGDGRLGSVPSPVSKACEVCHIWM